MGLGDPFVFPSSKEYCYNSFVKSSLDPKNYSGNLDCCFCSSHFGNRCFRLFTVKHFRRKQFPI